MEYWVEPHRAMRCTRCAQTAIAVNMAPGAKPAGSGNIPEERTSQQYTQIATMTVPPACISLRPFTPVRLEPMEGGQRRRRITFEYEVPEGEPLYEGWYVQAPSTAPTRVRR